MAETAASPIPTSNALRYYDAEHERRRNLPAHAVHSEFLRTGRILRQQAWHADERRYLTYEEVATRTGRVLENAGETTHARLNRFHASIQFPKLVFHRTLKGSPHLGYCHVTAAKTSFAQFKDVRWAFYIANFFAEIGDGDEFFKDVSLETTKMYFAVAVDKDMENKKLIINRAIRGNGLLFRTQDPKTALKNVLLLGARHEALRHIIRAL